jgi:hypothetical protein
MIARLAPLVQPRISGCRGVQVKARTATHNIHPLNFSSPTGLHGEELLLTPIQTLRVDHFEPLAPCGGREAGIETHDFERRRVVIGGHERRRQL